MTFPTHEDPKNAEGKNKSQEQPLERHHAALLLGGKTMERLSRDTFLFSHPDNRDLSPYKLAKIVIQLSKHIYRGTKLKHKPVYFVCMHSFSGASWGT